MFTSITYDFFYTADNNPWFCSYSVTIMDDKYNILHSELVQLDDVANFERLQKNAIEQGFALETSYTNPATGTHGTTYRKYFGID